MNTVLYSNLNPLFTGAHIVFKVTRKQRIFILLQGTNHPYFFSINLLLGTGTHFWLRNMKQIILFSWNVYISFLRHIRPSSILFSGWWGGANAL